MDWIGHLEGQGRPRDSAQRKYEIEEVSLRFQRVSAEPRYWTVHRVDDLETIPEEFSFFGPERVGEQREDELGELLAKQWHGPKIVGQGHAPSGDVLEYWMFRGRFFSVAGRPDESGYFCSLDGDDPQAVLQEIAALVPEVDLQLQARLDRFQMDELPRLDVRPAWSDELVCDLASRGVLDESDVVKHVESRLDEPFALDLARQFNARGAISAESLQRLVEGARGTARAVVARPRLKPEVKHSVWQRDQGQCVECGSNERLEYDHIIPVARGGSSTERNLQLLCESCNRRKAATI